MKKKIVLLLLTVLFCNSLIGCTGGVHTKGGSGGIVMNSPAMVEKGSYEIMDSMTSSHSTGIIYDRPEFNTEEYNHIVRNDFKKVSVSPLSTFAIDVDTGSYPAFRNKVNDGYSLSDMPSGMIRTEEMLNYFEYEFAETVYGDKFDISYELGECPWEEDNLIAALTVKSEEIDRKAPPRNFVILFDTSGSMDSVDKGYLALYACSYLVDTVTEDDRISIVTYANDSDIILDGSNNSRDIDYGLDRIAEMLQYGGGTNGSGGITAAYELARSNFIEGGNNRVIIFSDGDMNLGVTSQSELVDLVQKNAKESNIFLTTLGFGTGNYSDANMEQIANKGNGNYYYIDSIAEAKRVLKERLNQSTLTIAKDVKLQVEFNPMYVSEYKLLGYENRAMADEDFENDEKDGGEVGPNQCVTVLYEIVPTKEGSNSKSNLKYQETPELSEEAKTSNELMTLSIRYKEPDEDESVLEQFALFNKTTEPSDEFRFVCGIAKLVDNIGSGKYKELYLAVDLLESGVNLGDEFKELYDLVNVAMDYEKMD